MDHDADKTRRDPPAECRVLICPAFAQHKTGHAVDRAQLASFNFLNPLIWVVGSSSVTG
jgi:hypothetical protein